MSYIIIDKNKQCLCDCATKCITGKTGSAMRCTKEEIENKGYKTKNFKEILQLDYYLLGEKRRTMNILNRIYKWLIT